MSEDGKLKTAYQKAYGDYWEQKFSHDMAARMQEKLNVAEKSEQKAQVQEAPVQDAEQWQMAQMDEAPVKNAQQMQEAPVVEQTAPAPEKEAAVQPQTQGDKTKDEFPSLFSMFTEMLGGDGKQGGDDEISAMFALAFSALLGIDKFKERLEEAERALAEAMKREQEKEAAEVAKAPSSIEKEAAEVQRVASEISPKEGASLAKMAELQGTDLSKVKLKTPADMAYDKIAQGKDQVTLADLQKAGVNLKTDLQPTLRALTKDHPEKLAEFAPKGLGDEKAPVNREFATALIARAQQREAITRHNALSR